MEKGAELGYQFARSTDDNRHIDDMNFNKVGLFSFLWGSYINALPKGNMGNLTVVPGTHHVIASILKNEGSYFFNDEM